MIGRPVVHADALDEWALVGPSGSTCFGEALAVLPNGNIVVTDPCWNDGVGAAYLYDGATRAVISTLTGSLTGNNVGLGVTVLANGNYVVSSWAWDAAGAQEAGATTWGDQARGVSGVVSSANSIVGSTAADGVGVVVALTNGNYVVSALSWDRGSMVDAGAVRWASGTAATVGPISVGNSLVGASAHDVIGRTRSGPGGIGVMALANGNYVVTSQYWDNGPIVDAGAVTWGSGSAGASGPVTPTNSLVGSTAQDWVGSTQDGVAGENDTPLAGVVGLSNGNYVVPSPFWDRGSNVNVGAATWGNGNGGTVGTVSAANSLIGSIAGHEIAAGGSAGRGVVALANGNYVVVSPFDGILSQGAVTWGDGSTGTIGTVGPGNSLQGTHANDRVGAGEVTALTNGNYVVASLLWTTDGTPNTAAGAMTWGNGTTGTVGLVSAANSLVGSNGQHIGVGGVTALTNGNFVVASPWWGDGTTSELGAVTWGDGAIGIHGAVTASNSLIGSSAEDGVGYRPTVALANGNYVVADAGWDNGSVLDVGAVTWGNGAVGTTGRVTAANSMIGSTESDQVGAVHVVALTNGNYVVASGGWQSVPGTAIGATTWANGSGPTSLVVGTSNSLVGAEFEPYDIVALANGGYVGISGKPNVIGNADAVALTPLDGTRATSGVPNADNSVVGPDKSQSNIVFDPIRNRLLVAEELRNTVVIVELPGLSPLPVAQPDYYTVQRDTRLDVVAPGLLANDGGPAGQALTATIATAPAHGTVVLAADGSFTYAPANGFSGTDQFTYTVSDNDGTSAAAAVTLDVRPADADQSPVSPAPPTAGPLRTISTTPDLADLHVAHRQTARP
ncbi:MAG: Ig-like domain-containing protein [Ilumatobacteraceae bacterium]